MLRIGILQKKSSITKMYSSPIFSINPLRTVAVYMCHKNNITIYKQITVIPPLFTLSIKNYIQFVYYALVIILIYWVRF